MEKMIENIQKEISRKRLYNTVKEVSNFHRIQASTGFREAAEFVCKKINALGIHADILSYEANENQWYLQQKMFQEWDCKEATLDLEDEKIRLADFSEEAISIIQKSYPCDFRNNPLDVVLVEGHDPEYLDSLNLKGKIAFIHTMPNEYMKEVIKERGAVGFITDFMREVPDIRSRNDAYDTLNYTSFWWTHDQDEPKTFGFVLSPRKGDYLKSLCLKYEKEHQKDASKPRYPRVKAYINSSLYPGKLEVVEAVLRGKSKEEIMMSAHLCHPRSSANDNASGVAGSIEALRVLKSLQDQGKIELEKTIRLILIPEFTGTFCYLSSLSSYDHIKGAINMDMIGGKQDGFYGPITITKTHKGLKSPINSIASYVLKECRQQVPALFGGKVPLVNSILSEYSGGSDHTVFCDMTIGVPCVMLGQWPDKYYHTSSDTLECVDPNVLAFSTSVAALYVYTLSNFDQSTYQKVIFDHIDLMNEDIKNIYENETEYPYARMKSIVEYYRDSMEQFKSLAPVDVSKEKDHIYQLGMSLIEMLQVEKKELTLPSQNTLIPIRKFVGPIDKISGYSSISEGSKEAIEEYSEVSKKYGFGAMMMEESILRYMDGKRTIDEIQKEIILEDGKADPDFIAAYCRLLKKLNLIEFR